MSTPTPQVPSSPPDLTELFPILSDDASGGARTTQENGGLTRNGYVNIIRPHETTFGEWIMRPQAQGLILLVILAVAVGFYRVSVLRRRR